MSIILRPYQDEIINKARDLMSKGRRRILIQAPTGSGKTALTAHMMKTAASKGMTSWFMVHRRELIKQSAATFSKVGIDFGVAANGFYFDTKPMTHICSVQSMKSRAHKLKQPKLIIWDECFVFGTDVDGVPIQDRRVGDVVRSVDESTGLLVCNKVTNIFKSNAPSKLYRMTCGAYSIVGTYSHPVFVKGSGWINLGDIKNGDYIYMHRLQNGKRNKDKWCKEVPALLSKINVFKEHDRVPGKNEKKQPDENIQCSTKGFKHVKENKSQANHPWRKRNRTNSLSKKISGFFGSWVGHGVRCCNKNLSWVWPFDSLQNRHSKQTENDCNRGGWQLSLFFKKKRTGQEKGNVFEISRVDSVEVYKQGIDSKYDELCPDGFVYNLEVENTHTYFANNILVHNCHHIGAATWERIFLENPQAFHIGLTATPCRLDGKGLSEFYDEMILGPSTSWLIENKFLAPFKYFAPKNIDTSKLHTSMGDYVKSEVNELVTDKKIIGDAVSEYNKYCKDKRAVVFCASVNHSLYIRDEFLKHGIPCAHLDGEHDSNYRDQVLSKFTSGEIKVLCNVDLFGEGFDLPAIDAVIMLRPTQSLGLYLQQVGRSLRTFPGKEHAIILDHVGNWQRHGLPDDEREWSLAGVNRKKKDESEKKIKICSNCFAAVEYFPCSNCGQSPDPKKRGEIEQEDGELQEVSRDQARKDFRKQQGRAQTLQDLIELGRSRGYKRPEFWAKAVFNGRRNRI